MDLRASLDAALGAFALDAVVTVPGAEPVETRAFWLPDDTVGAPAGNDVRRSERRRVLVLPLADVPQVPRGTVITVPEYEGAPATDWMKDGESTASYDHVRIWVVPNGS